MKVQGIASVGRPFATLRRNGFGGLCILAAAVGFASVVSLSVGSAGAATQCRGRYPNLVQPAFDRLVVVFKRQHLTCSQATRVGNSVGNAYARGLPVADYPPPPKGVPGGKGRTFSVRTPYGKFSCQMTARGSDFVNGTCRRGLRFVRFSSTNDFYVHGQ